MNLTRNALVALPYNEAIRVVDLTQNVNLHRYRFSLTALVTVAGGAADGALVEDGPARLLQSIELLRDGFAHVDKSIGGKDIRYLNRRGYLQVFPMTTLAIPGVQANTPIRFDGVIDLGWPFLADPYDVFLAAQEIKSQLQLRLQFAKDKTTAASDSGSGVLISGGDRTVTITNFNLDIVEYFSVSNRQPLYQPILTGANDSDQFAAANANLPYRILSQNKVLYHLVRMEQGALRALQGGGINRITLKGGQIRWTDACAYDTLKGEEVQTFPAVPSTENAVLMMNYADNGKLGSILDPSKMGTDPKIFFDVDAPTAAPGVVRVVSMELFKTPGITRN